MTLERRVAKLEEAITSFQNIVVTFRHEGQEVDMPKVDESDLHITVTFVKPPKVDEVDHD